MDAAATRTALNEMWLVLLIAGAFFVGTALFILLSKLRPDNFTDGEDRSWGQVIGIQILVGGLGLVCVVWAYTRPRDLTIGPEEIAVRFAPPRSALKFAPGDISHGKIWSSSRKSLLFSRGVYLDITLVTGRELTLAFGAGEGARASVLKRLKEVGVRVDSWEGQ